MKTIQQSTWHLYDSYLIMIQDKIHRLDYLPEIIKLVQAGNITWKLRLEYHLGSLM